MVSTDTSAGALPARFIALWSVTPLSKFDPLYSTERIMGEAFAFNCWVRLAYPSLSKLGTPMFGRVAFDEWRRMSADSIPGDAE